MRQCFRLFALLASALTVYGQNASLSGFIRDATNAAVPRAAVEIRSVSTGLSYKTLSNDAGVYAFGSLKPGSYEVTVQAAGFQTDVHHGLKLDVLQQANLDFTLRVGETRETVTVTGNASLIQTSDASVSTVIAREFIENMPLNGRSFNSLVELSPGTVMVATNESSRGMYAINGQRSDANSYMVDGVSANMGVSSSKGIGQGGGGSSVGADAVGGTNNLVSMDALQEFRILTSTYAPEYGRTAGGQIAIVTRSGTNQFHGTAFDYLRNDKLDANDWFANRAGQGKVSSRQNDFGAVFGGPIKKDRTFFFFSYEGLRLRQPTFAITDVPSLALRQQAPAYLQPFLNLFPLPTGADEIDAKTGKLNGFAPAVAAISSPSTLNATSLKIDHMLNSKVQLFGRYNYAPSNADTRAGSITSAISSYTRFISELSTLTVGAVALLNPTMTNDLRANYSRSRGDRHFYTDTVGGGVPLPDSVWYPPGFTSNDAGVTFAISSGSHTGVAQGPLSNMINQQYNIVDTLAVVKGAHQLKFGLDYRHYNTAGKFNSFQASVTYADTGFLNNVPGTILSGLGSATISVTRPGDMLFNSWSTYAQDTWKLKPRLTLTYGVRWEVEPPPGAGSGLQPFAVTEVTDPATMALAPAGTSLYHTRYRNFAPRAGVAYQLSQDPKWMSVVRGGFGGFYDTGFGALSSLLSYQPFVATGTLSNVKIPAYPLPSTPQFATTPPISGLQSVDPNLRLPLTWQWNISVQQSLGGSQSLTVSYVGAAGRKLYVQNLYLGVSPSFTALTTLGTNDSSSDYDALQVQFDHRFSRGLQVLASYAWSHAIDTASNDTATVIYPPNFYSDINRGNADFDVRHIFTVAAVYQIPTPKFGGAVGRAILGGWAIDPLIRAHSALPIDITNTRTVNGSSITSRVNLIPGQPLYIDDPTVPGGRRFNPLAFVAPAGFVQGGFGRNVMRGFGMNQFDLSAHRLFTLRERVKLQVRGDFFNAFNHPNFGNPNGAYSTSALFGVATSMLGRSLNSASGGGFNALYQVGGPRSIQLSMKLSF